MPANSPPQPPDSRLVSLVVATVTVVWAVSLLISLLIREYEVLVYTTPLMGLCVGYVTGIKVGKHGRT